MKTLEQTELNFASPVGTTASSDTAPPISDGGGVLFKRCAKCHCLVSVSCYSKCRHHKDGLHSYCKSCDRRIQSSGKYKKARSTPESKARRLASNRKQENVKARIAWNRSEKGKAKAREYHVSEKGKAKVNEWKLANRDTILEKQRRRHRDRMESDINYRISKTLRSRIGSAIRGKCKRGSAIRDLGCTTEEFKVYMSTKFKDGMSWDNWGVRGWHIDHIVPLSCFDLSDREQFLRACHYTNTQPLWAKDNLRKSNSVDVKKGVLV
jgi:hypothetical protein